MYFLRAGQEVIRLTKTENVLDMLRLIAENPGELGPKELAEALGVSERAIFRYATTAISAGVMIHFKDKGYTLHDEFWLNFLIRYRKGTGRSKKHLVALLTTAVKFTEDEETRKRGEEFLVLLGVEKQKDKETSE